MTIDPRKTFINTGKERARSPLDPLSPQWWQSFLNKKPDWYGPGAWHPRAVDFGEMEQLKKVMLADLKIVVIGGSHRYQSPDDLANFFSPSYRDRFGKHIDIGHTADFFLGGSQGGAQVFHFPAIDALEMSKEAHSFANRTGNAIYTSQEELERRVEKLVQDKTIRLADAIVINHDIAVPVPEDGTFENYINYLDELNQRNTGIMKAMCQIWIKNPQADGKSRRIIVLRNSLFWLSLMHPHHSIHSSEAIERERQTTEELQNEARVGIELIIRMEEIIPHDSNFVEVEWRNRLNNFFRLGHKQSIKRQIGIDLAIRVVYGDIGPSEDEIDELYDRVLEWFLPTCLSRGNSSPLILSMKQHEFLQQCVDSGIGWRSSWLDESEDDSDTGESSSAIDQDSTPLSGLCALVLDNGRDDGVTAACCKGLSKMGAALVLSFIGNEYEDGATKAGKLVETLRQAGGKVAAVGGIPYRMKSRSHQPPGVRFVEELIDQALHDLGHSRIDIVGRILGNGQALNALCLYKTWEATVVHMLDQWRTVHFVQRTAKILKLLVHPWNCIMQDFPRFVVPDMDDFEIQDPLEPPGAQD
ncbi:hypothetical protein N0V82_004953 [Gnomoniopsis sp. IMI 355080]|nr:hypothetical protein N0V82_004953 [Gnomoniopsis sp. IMI 355080]